MKTSPPGVMLCGFFFAATLSGFAQGSLTPPGAPAPTMKSLDQVEPRMLLAGGTNPLVVSQPGSYYLTGNVSITAGSSSNGINIFVSNVTIDLNGFELAGSGPTSGVGVIIAGGESNVTIRNGTIRNWGSHGINGSGNSKVRTENLRVLNNGGNGILADVNAEVINCIAESNVGFGIKVLDNSIVKDSQAIATSGTNAYGISVGSKGVVTGCVARNNSGYGILSGGSGNLTNCIADNNSGSGIYSDYASNLTNCVANNNSAFGISVSDGSTLTNCTASHNTDLYGIGAGNGSTLTNCTASYNIGYFGITADGGTLTNCTAFGNTSSQLGSSGISAGNRSTLIGCTVTNTGSSYATPSGATGAGIQVGYSSTVKDCTVSDSKGDGIRAGSGCVILNNTCTSNGSGAFSGIHATGQKNRIEGNAAIDNQVGFKVDSDGNLIIKNSNRGGGGTAFSLAAGNSEGQEIIVYDPATTTTINSSNAWANFLY